MSEVSRYTSAIPPLNTVKDADVRRVLEALVSGWRTRNGETKPNSDERFITKGELQKLVYDANRGYFAPGAPGAGLFDDALGDSKSDILDYVNRTVDDKQREVLNSPLWAELGERIRQVDTALVSEQLQRIDAVQQQADSLAAEAAARLGFEAVTGSAINSIQEVNDAQALQISGLTTRVNGAESTIISLQSTTATQATSLTQLTTRVGEAESSITDLETTTANQAQTLSSLSTRVGSTESSISTLNTTTANQANTINTLVTQSAQNRAAITNEATTRANADNAITQSVSTQLSTVNNNIAALQTSNNTLTNSVGSLSSTVTTLNASVGNLSSALSTEATVRANADGTLFSQYTVKVDNNGLVSGFGLASTLNNGVPFSEFIIRADRFAIGSPGTSRKVPFIVEGGTVYIDTALIKNAAIGRAKIGIAEIDTLRLANGSVTSMSYAAGGYQVIPAGGAVGAVAVGIVMDSGSSGVVVTVTAVMSGNQSPGSSMGIFVYRNGSYIGADSVSVPWGFRTTFTLSFFDPSPSPGYNVYQMNIGNGTGGDPGSFKSTTLFNSSITATGGKR